MQFEVVKTSQLPPLVSFSNTPRRSKYSELFAAIAALKVGESLRIVQRGMPPVTAMSRISAMLRRRFGKLSNVGLRTNRSVNGDIYVTKYRTNGTCYHRRCALRVQP